MSSAWYIPSLILLGLPPHLPPFLDQCHLLSLSHDSLFIALGILTFPIPFPALFFSLFFKHKLHLHIYIYIYIYIYKYLCIYLSVLSLSCHLGDSIFCIHLGNFSCGMQTELCHTGSSSLTRDGTQAPAFGQQSLSQRTTFTYCIFVSVAPTINK